LNGKAELVSARASSSEKISSLQRHTAFIEVEDYQAFENKFGAISDATELSTYTIFGAGKVALNEKIYGYKAGECKGISLGESFYCLGASKNKSELFGASVAPNDSGGPITDKTGKIVAIATRTTLSWAYNTVFPAISTGVLLKTSENRNFLEKFLY